jgi:hypothetical protein
MLSKSYRLTDTDYCIYYRIIISVIKNTKQSQYLG